MCENVSINNRYSDVPERNNALENGLQNTEIYKTRRKTTEHDNSPILFFACKFILPRVCHL